jgi:G3E family GTPase
VDRDVTTALPDPADLTLVREAPIPVAVVTGFLGSGKTTLIGSLLRDPAFEGTAIIVNEFGEIALDHLLVEAAEEDTVLLEGGCLCCASRGDLVRALRSLLDRRERAELPAYRRVILETSGLADPVPILQTLMSDPLRLSRYKLAGLTATVDCLLGTETLRRHGEAERQIAFADRILITKSDLADEKRFVATTNAIRALSAAPIETAASMRVGLFRPFTSSFGLAGPSDAHHHGSYVTVARILERSLPWSRVEAWLGEAVERCGANLLRLKAIVPVENEDRPVAVQAVQHVIHRPEYLDAWPDHSRQGRMVVIGQAIERGVLERMLDDLDP